ncbi:MAG: RagB/SusD family nutrient uptake outer membrane protein [Bacteroidales bacterium]|nr:RagB/SusD family nutrient uptake outer membrane protein [Bacteroidales bacterium]
MKNIVKTLAALAATLTLAAGCIQETLPQGSTVTADQVAAAPGAFDLFVSSVTNTLAGKFVYAPSSTNAYDFGLPAFFLRWDLMGNDLVIPALANGWFDSWYCIDHLGPTWANSQYAWTFYYKWIKACNDVISLAGEDPDADKVVGAGIARFYRAYYYMDLAQMFATKPCYLDGNAETVPIVTEATNLNDLQQNGNPRATNTQIFELIISDLDKAEQYLAGYNRSDVYSPDVSVVYGLKARAYLLMGEWQNARDYAKKAQAGYTIMDEATYTDWDRGFNTPTSSWMLGLTYKSDDPNIQLNDADSSWGSWMIMEINPNTSGCGYAANYGRPFYIDRHLYETVPETDFRKKCFVDFALDEMSKEDALEALEAYSNHGDWLYAANVENSDFEAIGGLNLKYRPNGGEAGRDNQYIGFTVAVPMMRVEEMYLIEAEAAGRLNEADGIALLTAFAKTRDASYEYGTHTDAYYNTTSGTFINEVWWQRRIEFWGEGLATKDVKRLQKGVIRSYPGTNHVETYRYNVSETPGWMNLCIVQTETNYNFACTNNPEPVAPNGDSDEYVW